MIQNNTLNHDGVDTMNRTRSLLFGAAALAAGTGFILLGVARGEPYAVLHKAALICLECIGIG